MDTLGSSQQVTFLTEKGLCKVLFKSRKPIAEKFQNWVCEVILYKNGIGQYDLNNNLIKEFTSKYDCIRELKMSDKTLAKSLKNNIPYNNYYYKELGSKLYII